MRPIRTIIDKVFVVRDKRPQSKWDPRDPNKWRKEIETTAWHLAEYIEHAHGSDFNKDDFEVTVASHPVMVCSECGTPLVCGAAHCPKCNLDADLSATRGPEGKP